MTFTYDMTTPTNRERVRFHLGDTESATAMFTDEEITFVIAEAGTWQAAVVACIRSAIARLAQEPDMQADWLRVDWRRSAENWRALLAEKKQEFGLGARATSSTQHAYRADSYQDESPDWDAVFNSDDLDLEGS